MTRIPQTEKVAALKHDLEGDLVVLGSGELAQGLIRRALVDRYLLLIHPLVPGSGRRLFRDAGPRGPLRLVDS